MSNGLHLRVVCRALLAHLAAAVALQAQAPAPQSASSELLRPGDVVQLRIWREKDLSGDFPVDESGAAVFPKIGPHRVVDESPESLRQKLLAEYQRYLRNPSIEIVFLRRVTILGAV